MVEEKPKEQLVRTYKFKPKKFSFKFRCPTSAQLFEEDAARMRQEGWRVASITNNILSGVTAVYER